MEDGKGGAGTSSRVSASLVPSAPPPPQPSSSSNPPKESMVSAKRQMFSAELKPGGTTIVSWKKLLKEAGKGSGNPPDLAAADPVSDSGPGPAAAAVQPFEGELQDAQPSNRFSSVIEKIERLYMGKQSSDEEERDDIPDDDQYDTEDSFIDDAELDEYFQVDTLSTKHNGFFVNRGKLEKIEASSSPNPAPKKRRRKDSSKVSTEADQEHDMSDSANMGNVRLKAAARSAPLMGKKLANPAIIQTADDENYPEGKFLKNKPNASSGTFKKKSADIMSNLENVSAARIAKDVSSPSLESNDIDKHKGGLLSSRDLNHKSRLINESIDPVHYAARDGAFRSPSESLPRKQLNYENEREISAKIRRKERYVDDGFPNIDSAMGAYPMRAAKHLPLRVKNGSAIRHKGTTLERAICDLEKIVALCRPPKLDVQELDSSSQLVKRRLPQEVKQKLAKVARLSASQNKISEEELIDRLMGIVGHIVQRKTLKRNMREMVELGLSAKQEKNGRFQQVKQEVNEMIKTRVSLLKSKMTEEHDGSADDFQVINGNDERRAVRKYGVDIALEDKICELYNLYVEGMDEGKGPQIRKLYEELAELWPNGYMDGNGIKDAIFRSKERKRSRIYRHKAREEERIKRKKLASAARTEGTVMGVQVQSEQQRSATGSAARILSPSEKVTTNQPVSTSGRLLEPSPQLTESGHPHVSKHHDKAQVSSSTSMVTGNGSKTAVGDVKKLKRKPEPDLGEIHVHPTKLPSHPGKERLTSRKQSDDSSSNHQPKPNIQLPGPSASSDQQS